MDDRKPENSVTPVTPQKRKSEDEDIGQKKSKVEEHLYASDSEEEPDYGWDNTNSYYSREQLYENIARNTSTKTYIDARNAIINRRKRAKQRMVEMKGN